MLRFGATCLLALALAPYQCAASNDPSKAHEETPGEALHALALDFRARGDERSAQATLAFLVARYPSSRFAKAARDELGDGGRGDAGP